MSTTARAGVAALIGAPLLALVSNAVLPTLSDDGADRVAALTAHHGRAIAGMTLQTLSIAIMIAGIAWLVAALLPRAPRLAAGGGVLAVAGALVVLFEDGVTAVSAPVVHALTAGQAATVLDRIGSSAAVKLEPLALLFDIGVALLGAAAVKAGAPRWLGIAVAVSALVDAVGEASASRPLVLIGFAALLACFGGVAAAVTGQPRWQTTRAAVSAA